MFNKTNQTNETPPGYKHGILPFNQGNVTICLLAVLLNGVEMVIIIRKKKILNFERTLLSLCVADMLVSLLYLCQAFYQLVHDESMYGHFARDLVQFPLEIFAVMSSVTNIIVLGVDRLLAVKYPLKHAGWMTSRTINTLIAAAWVGGIALSVISYANRFAAPADNSDAAWFTAMYIFSGLLFSSGFVIIIIYGMIVFTVTRRAAKVRQMRHSESQSRGDEFAVTITCILVVAAFTICSYPYAVARLISRRPILKFKTILLNPLLDPLVYFFKGLLQRKLKKKGPNPSLSLSTITNKTNDDK